MVWRRKMENFLEEVMLPNLTAGMVQGGKKVKMGTSLILQDGPSP
jgi:hypothetical protein